MGGWFLGADGDEDLKIYLLWPKLLKKKEHIISRVNGYVPTLLHRIN